MPVIVALDFDSGAEALALVDTLGQRAGHFKVGLQLFTAEGPEIVRELVRRDKRVFLDLKLHEIPTSVASGVRMAGRLGASLVTVHASAGSAALRAAVEAARAFEGLQVLALTVITSLRESDLEEIGVVGPLEDQVTRLARLAVGSGCAGVVASAQEARVLAGLLPSGTLLVTPGIKFRGGDAQDQARVATPEAAVQAGATHLVIGRAVARAADPVSAFEMAAAAFA